MSPGPGVQLWIWDSTNEEWVKLAGTSEGAMSINAIVEELNDIEDVDVASPSDLDIVYWNDGNSKWEAKALSAFTVPAHKDRHDPEDGADPLDCAAPSELAGVQASGEGSAHTFARSDHAHQIQHAITDNHLVTVDGSPNSGEVMVWTANGADGKTYAEFHALQFASALPEQVAVKLDATLSADGQYCVTMALEGTAGTDLAYGECVYFAVADSKWEKAKGDAEATVSPMTGIVIVAGDEDAAIVVAIMGEVRADAAFPSLTVGAPVFIDPDTAGDVTSTELTTGEYQKAIGWAKTANVVVLTGNPDWVKVG